MIPRWREDALCRESRVQDLFLPPPDHEARDDRWYRQRAAKAVCEGCPVRPECLEYALRLPSSQRSVGVWAGATAHEIDRALTDGDVERLESIAHDEQR